MYVLDEKNMEFHSEIPCLHSSTFIDRKKGKIVMWKKYFLAFFTIAGTLSAMYTYINCSISPLLYDYTITVRNVVVS